MDADGPMIKQAYTLMCMQGWDAVESVEMLSAQTLGEAVRRADALLSENPQYACVEVWEDERRLAVRLRVA